MIINKDSTTKDSRLSEFKRLEKSVQARHSKGYEMGDSWKKDDQ